jgi:hypothetical protein
LPVTVIIYVAVGVALVVVTETLELKLPVPVTLTEGGFEQVGTGGPPPVMAHVKLTVPLKPFTGMTIIVRRVAPPEGAVIVGGVGGPSMRM